MLAPFHGGMLPSWPRVASSQLQILQFLVQPSLDGISDASSNHINPNIGRLFHQPEVPFHFSQPTRYCWDTVASVLLQHFQFQPSDSCILRHNWSRCCRCFQGRSHITHCPKRHVLDWDATHCRAQSFNWWFLRRSTHPCNCLLHVLL